MRRIIRFRNVVRRRTRVYARLEEKHTPASRDQTREERRICRAYFQNDLPLLERARVSIKCRNVASISFPISLQIRLKFLNPIQVNVILALRADVIGQTERGEGKKKKKKGMSARVSVSHIDSLVPYLFRRKPARSSSRFFENSAFPFPPLSPSPPCSLVPRITCSFARARQLSSIALHVFLLSPFIIKSTRVYTANERTREKPRGWKVSGNEIVRCVPLHGISRDILWYRDSAIRRNRGKNGLGDCVELVRLGGLIGEEGRYVIGRLTSG